MSSIMASLVFPIPSRRLTDGERRRVVAEAERWIGTPWKHGARVLGAGVDCGQLLIGVYAAAGVIEEFDPPPYHADFALHRGDPMFLRLVERFAAPVEKPSPGDVALFRWGRHVSHAAVVTEWPEVIHADRRGGCVLRDSAEQDPRLGGRFVAGFWEAWV